MSEIKNVGQNNRHWKPKTKTGQALLETKGERRVSPRFAAPRYTGWAFLDASTPCFSGPVVGASQLRPRPVPRAHEQPVSTEQPLRARCTSLAFWRYCSVRVVCLSSSRATCLHKTGIITRKWWKIFNYVILCCLDYTPTSLCHHACPLDSLFCLQQTNSVQGVLVQLTSSLYQQPKHCRTHGIRRINIPVGYVVMLALHAD